MICLLVSLDDNLCLSLNRISVISRPVFFLLGAKGRALTMPIKASIMKTTICKEIDRDKLTKQYAQLDNYKHDGFF